MLNKSICLIVAVILGITSYSFADGCEIIVKDNKNNPVQFILKSDNKELKSDKKGILLISGEDYEANKQNIFRFDFVKELAELIYEKRLIKNQQESEENQLAKGGGYVLQDLCKGPRNEFSVPNLKRGLKPKY